MPQSMHANEARAARSAERGFSIISAMFWTVFAAIVVSGTAQIVVYGTITGRRSHIRDLGRAAASAIVEARPPAEPGGSVAPDAAVSGYSDVVTVDPDTGAILPGDDVAGYRFRRQWRLSQGADGVWVFEASSELLAGNTAERLDGPDGALVTTSRLLER